MEIKTRLSEAYTEKYTKEGYWTNKTLDAYLARAVDKVPEKEAVIEGEKRVTYRELGQRVDRMALGLLELGIEKGDVVSFQLPSWLETVVIHHAVAKIGAITNPIIPIYRSKEVKYILRNSEAKALIIPREFRKFDYVQMISELRNELPALKHILVMGGGDLPEGMSSFDAFMETRWEARRDPESLKGIKVDPNDITLIMFTSGTESNPKGVLHTTNTLLHENRSLIQATDLSEDDVIFIPTPVTHITGLLYGLQLPQMLKAKVVLMDMWHPDKGIEIIAKERCTWMVGATPFLLGMGRSPALAEHDISCLRSFGCGGAECPPSAITDFVAKVPGCTAGRGYGSTEYPTVSVSSLGASLEKSSRTDGIPVMGTEVRIIDEDGNEVPVGTSGEITARGPECFVGYLDPTLNDNYFDQDGWFHTGDLGRIDEDGFIEVTGRKKDIIIRGGENISSKEVEDTLFRHPDISEVAVVAMPDSVMQEKVCAYVVPKPGKSIALDDLISFLEQTELAKQKWPERLEVTDSFPTTAAGKVKKFLLRKDVREKLGHPSDK